MICDRLENSSLYALNDRFRKAFRFLERVNAETELGTIELDGRDVYAMVQEYDTVEEEPVKLESHHKYADIQYTISGGEIISVSNIADLTVLTAYDAEKDVEWRMPPSGRRMHRLEMTHGMFVVLFPEDGHYGKLMSDAAKFPNVRKVVVKVRL